MRRRAAVLAVLSLALLSLSSAHAQQPPPPPAAAAQPPAGAAQPSVDAAQPPPGELRVRASSLIAEVWIDGARAGYATTSTPPLRVAPGQHLVEIRAAGHQPQRREITITSGEVQDLPVTLERLESRPPLVQEPPPHARITRTVNDGTVVYLPTTPPERQGKSVSFIIGGFSSAAMLVTLGSIFVSIPDSEPHHVLGIGVLAVGGALAVGTATYALWPQASPTSASLNFSSVF
ncbi:PEGA domain-containing protein [Chondromyces apiculatus]|uniref:PEGA domain-containing protein n=1 Tax=Chondromyces apiculatus DSM 436 TaxID=1192034 RepID=A0A017TBG7_9BACT|nr:PEGA domain-containing protein [Chondromyces apiculatus]EYF06623.1 Hypothetical protein CAP_1753 [Chondromyces apiculatus DSM 436]